VFFYGILFLTSKNSSLNRNKVLRGLVGEDVFFLDHTMFSSFSDFITSYQLNQTHYLLPLHMEDFWLDTITKDSPLDWFIWRQYTKSLNLVQKIISKNFVLILCFTCYKKLSYS